MKNNAKLKPLLTISQHQYELNIHSWLRDVSVAYVSAIKRTEAMIYMLPATIHATIIQERILIESVYEVTGKIGQPDTSDPEIASIIRVAEEKLASSRYRDLWGQVETHNDAVDRWEQSYDAPQIAGGLQAFLSAIITTSWTTFEILAGDLWVEALNHHPHVLSDLSGKRSRTGGCISGKSSRSGGDRTASSGDKVVSLSQIQMYSYDLSSHMGSILRQAQSFDKLDGIRSAYMSAFSVDSALIDEVIGRKELDSLSLLRNLLVHRGGKIDSKYINRSVGLSLCPAGELDQQISLDGRMVAGLVIPVIFAGYHLIEAVDAWVFAHPNKTRTSAK